MRPEYANTFGLRKVANSSGELLKITLDASYKYMETTITATAKGIENISTPAAHQVASIVMTKETALSLRRLLDQTLEEL